MVEYVELDEEVDVETSFGELSFSPQRMAGAQSPVSVDAFPEEPPGVSAGIGETCDIADSPLTGLTATQEGNGIQGDDVWPDGVSAPWN